MTIKQLSAGQGNVSVEGVITEMGEVRTFNKFGKELRVANAMLQDDSGSVKLSLWNDDAIKFKEGDKIKIENGYVGEFQGEKQLTSGKYGKIIKLGEGEVPKKIISKKKSEEDEEDSEGGEDESMEEVEDALEEDAEEEVAEEEFI